MLYCPQAKGKSTWLHFIKLISHVFYKMSYLIGYTNYIGKRVKQPTDRVEMFVLLWTIHSVSQEILENRKRQSMIAMLFVLEVASLFWEGNEVGENHASKTDVEERVNGTSFNVLGMVIIQSLFDSILRVIDR